MTKISKRFKKVVEGIDTNKAYSLEEAVKLNQKSVRPRNSTRRSNSRSISASIRVTPIRWSAASSRCRMVPAVVSVLRCSQKARRPMKQGCRR